MNLKVKLDKEVADVFRDLIKNGHEINNPKVTRSILQSLGCSNARGIVEAWYPKSSGRVMLTLEKPVKIVRTRPTLWDEVFFFLESD